MHISSFYFDDNLEVIDKQWTPTAEQDATRSRSEPLRFWSATCGNAISDDGDKKQLPDNPIDFRVVCGDASEAGMLKFVKRAPEMKVVLIEEPKICERNASRSTAFHLIRH